MLDDAAGLIEELQQTGEAHDGQLATLQQRSEDMEMLFEELEGVRSLARYTLRHL